MGLAPIARNLVADYFSKNRRDDHRPPLSAMAAYLRPWIFRASQAVPGVVGRLGPEFSARRRERRETSLNAFALSASGKVNRQQTEECWCPFLVVVASHECLGLFLGAGIETLIVDGFEAAIDHCIILTLCLKNTFVQIDVLHTHSLTIDYHITRNSLCCIVYYMLLINQTIHLGSKSHELGGAMLIVLVLENGSRQLLVEVEEG